jgi:hypothetical protein
MYIKLTFFTNTLTQYKTIVTDETSFFFVVGIEALIIDKMQIYLTGRYLLNYLI